MIIYPQALTGLHFAQVWTAITSASIRVLLHSSTATFGLETSFGIKIDSSVS